MLLSIHSVWAQTAYPMGVYQSMEELRLKSPSKQSNIIIEKRSGADKAMVDGNDFKITCEDEGVFKNEVKREWVAYSDGDHLYLNGFHFGIQFWYCLVLDEATLLIFNGVIDNNDAAKVAVLGGAIGSAAASKTDRLYIMDLRTMEVKKANKDVTRNYLLEFPEILAHYDNEPKKTHPDI